MIASGILASGTAVLAESANGKLAGPAALVVVLLLLIVTVFLIRNMDGRLRRLPKEFPDQQRRGRHRDDPPDAVSGPGLDGPA